MELNNDTTGLSSFYHHRHHSPLPQPPSTTPATVNHHSPLPQPPPATTISAATSPPPTNGISNSTPPTINTNNHHNIPSSGGAEVVGTAEQEKKKRGRPRKYFSPEQKAEAKRLAAALATSPVYRPKKKDHGLDFGGVAFNKSQFAAFGNTGQSFTPHVITVNAGEDVNQKILLFMQQSKREICIMSASGSVSNASLSQPATSGGSITYEGLFNILSLKGSYVFTDLGGRTGGVSVCLSSSNGQIIGGSIGGPLIAAGPIEVIVGSFVIDTKKNTTTSAVKSDASASKMSSPVGGASVSGVINFRSPIDSSHQNIGGSQFNIQPPGMQSMDWRGSVGHGMLHSPENGDYEDSSE
ncbi:hypothetical protein Leryth_007478 [Lithospermum erythrorhizon]|nr:hypothetical protein Leryth_007478 [Lithospermum erythrorhizon]